MVRELGARRETRSRARHGVVYSESTMSRRSGPAIWLLTVCWILPALPASAGSPQAAALVRDAKRLMAQRQYAAACPKLQEAQRLAPSPKMLLELALCHEKEGKTAS